MRKLFTLSVCGAMVFLWVAAVWAGGIDNKTNWSVEYVRTLNRNAATDYADIVAYNPAGVIQMDDGMYGNISVHYIDKDYSNTIAGDESESTEPSYIPGVFALYKQDRWAAMFAFSNYGGGGKVEYDDGTWTSQLAGLGIIAAANSQLGAGGLPSTYYYTDISNQKIKAESMYLGYTLGGAYKINDMFSVSLGMRYIDASRESSGSITVSAANAYVNPLTQTQVNPDTTADIDFSQEATGWGGILGVNIAPAKQWNVGIRYETETQLDFENSVDKDNLGLLTQLGIEDGKSANRNLPAILALGVSYQVLPKLRLESDLTYYLNSSADWDGAEDDVDNGYDFGIGAVYKIKDNLEASLGLLYTETGIDPEDMTPEAPELDCKTIGAGVAYAPMPNLVLNFAVGNAFYDKDSFTDSASGTKVEYEKNNTFLGFGLQYKFF